MTSTPLSIRPRLVWASVIALLAAGATIWADVKGHGARTAFVPPPDFGDVRWATVPDAGEAVRVWGEAGLHGRKVLLLTGRWAQVKSMDTDAVDAVNGPGAAALFSIDANTAILAAARSAVARELAVVMPPDAFRRRLEEVRGAKELRVGEGWFTLPYHGYARRFSLPEAAAAPGEPVLALVEPSFFEAGAPEPLAAWLAARGFQVELGLVAMDDPAASPDERERAAAFARTTRAVAVEVAR